MFAPALHAFLYHDNSKETHWRQQMGTFCTGFFEASHIWWIIFHKHCMWRYCSAACTVHTHLYTQGLRLSHSITVVNRPVWTSIVGFVLRSRLIVTQEEKKTLKLMVFILFKHFIEKNVVPSVLQLCRPKTTTAYLVFLLPSEMSGPYTSVTHALLHTHLRTQGPKDAYRRITWFIFIPP